MTGNSGGNRRRPSNVRHIASCKRSFHVTGRPRERYVASLRSRTQSASFKAAMACRNSLATVETELVGKALKMYSPFTSSYDALLSRIAYADIVEIYFYVCLYGITTRAHCLKAHIGRQHGNVIQTQFSLQILVLSVVAFRHAIPICWRYALLILKINRQSNERTVCRRKWRASAVQCST
jgi:hypothetical protein